MVRIVLSVIALLIAGPTLASVDATLPAGSEPALASGATATSNLDDAVVLRLVDAGLAAPAGRSGADGAAGLNGLLELSRVEPARSPTLYWPLFLLALSAAVLMAVPRKA